MTIGGQGCSLSCIWVNYSVVATLTLPLVDNELQFLASFHPVLLPHVC